MIRTPKRTLAATAAIAFLAMGQPLLAQGCSMCKSSLASLQSMAAAINLGILILLFPPLLIMSAILFVAYQRGSEPEDRAHRSAGSDSGVPTPGDR